MPRIAPYAAVLIALPYLFVGGEALSRFAGGYELASLKLTRREPGPAGKVLPTEQERKWLDAVTFDGNVKPGWFFLAPAAMVNPLPNKEITERFQANPGEAHVNDIWNTKFLKRPNAYLASFLRKLKSEYVFAFDSYDGTISPHYRPYPRVGGNISTNDFGWYSTNVSIEKPANTIRIGMVGDSTQSNSIARYLQSYLSAWSATQKNPLKYEVLNASRPGASMSDVNGILKYELGPMSLDYVYLYKSPVIPYREMIAAAPGAHSQTSDRTQAVPIEKILEPALPWSALVAEFVEYYKNRLPDSNLWEPEKQRVLIIPPVLLLANSPTPEAAREIPYWKSKLADFDEFVQIAKNLHAKPIVSTERWYVPGEKPLKVQPNLQLFSTLNGPLFRPLTYRQIKWFLHLNNEIMSGWARQNKLDSVDIDGLMPDDPNLYTDGGHDVDFAWKLRAWIIFQSMIPLLENDIKAGLVPRPGPKTRNAHPFIHNPPLRISRKELLDYYAEEERANFNWLQMPDLAHGLDEDLLQAHPLSLDAFAPVDDAHLVGKSPLAIVTGSKKAGHAAIYPLKGSIHKPGSPAIVRINLRVDEGEFGVGLLSKDKKRAYSYTVVSKRPDPANLHLFIDSMEDVGSIVFANHREADGQSSRVSIFSIDVFQ